MDNNRTSSFPELLYAYKQTIEPVIKLISRIVPLPALIDNEEDEFFLYVLLFKGAFENEQAFEPVTAIVNDDSISEEQLQMHLNKCLSFVRNDAQRIGFNIAVEEFRNFIYPYLDKTKEAVVISERFDLAKKSNIIKESDDKFIREKGTSILAFFQKAFGIFCVIENYYGKLTTNETVSRIPGNEPVNEESASSQIEQPEENKFNGMLLKDVINHFYPLTTKLSADNRLPYLTEEQFHLYIKKAFCKNANVGMLSANLGEGEMEIMGALFLLFYDKCKKLGIVNKGKQKEYVGLLTENFTNYMHLKKTLPTNFRKYKNRFKSWL